MTTDVSAQLHSANVEGDLICGDACVCIERCDLWSRRVLNKHHQQSCCGQKRVCTHVVGGRVGTNDTCCFTFDMKKLDSTLPHPMCTQKKYESVALLEALTPKTYILPRPSEVNKKFTNDSHFSIK